jgi:alpha-L-fucosidase
MPKIAGMARSYQPGLLVVDRTVSGEFENYKTSEQQLPDKPLPYPWETCMTMGGSWSYVPKDNYKSARTLVHTLVKIVSRGGNLLLNIGPGPDGDWDPVAYERLKDIGAWIKVNGEGIYGSQAVVPYASGNQFYTQSKTKNTVYAFWLSETEEVALPAEIIIPFTASKLIKKISLLGNKQSLSWTLSDGNILLKIQPAVQQNKDIRYAACFKIDY